MTTAMDETTFDRLGREELSYLEEQLSEVDPDDIDITSSDGVLTLALRDGVRVVVNTHRAARQIWMAAVASAWHFDPPRPGSDRWCTPDGKELRATLREVIRDRIGIEVEL
ncbi:MAG TPA: iron donor protein CyaY [Kofleriaceae bacterium]|nr:iron donor protein CyaY [Kofleriaceae bacterium]